MTNIYLVDVRLCVNELVNAPAQTTPEFGFSEVQCCIIKKINIMEWL